MTQSITATDKLKCVERELKYRRHVYPRLVSTGRMKQEVAEYELAVMEAIRDDVAQMATAERLL